MPGWLRLCAFGGCVHIHTTHGVPVRCRRRNIRRDTLPHHQSIGGLIDTCVSTYTRMPAFVCRPPPAPRAPHFRLSCPGCICTRWCPYNVVAVDNPGSGGEGAVIIQHGPAPVLRRRSPRIQLEPRLPPWLVPAGRAGWHGRGQPWRELLL